MGAVYMEPYNSALMNMADYKKLPVVKQLIKNYYKLEELSYKGDMVAYSIFMDLELCLSSSNCLTEKQRTCITQYYLEGWTIQEMSEYHDKAKSTIHGHIDGGTKRIQRRLIKGVFNDTEGGSCGE